MKAMALFGGVLCLLVLVSPPAGAQLINNGASSAGNIGGPVWFNCDYSASPGDSIRLHYKGQNDGAFARIAMSPVGEAPFYDNTYESSLAFGANPIILEYFFSAGHDSLLATQSPKNTNNQFPPASYKYANLIADPQNDMAPGSAGSWLDLTGSGMTYSDTRLYCYLDNVSGTWPQSQLFTYFVYTFGFMITSGPDSSFYALVYGNVPLLISPGLYTLDRADSTYTQIGNINSTVSGGLLHMACDLTAFAADPAWPGWPPPEGQIMPMGATLTAGLSGQFASDFTYPAVYQPQTQYLNFGANTPPGLFAARVEIDSGIGITPRVGYLDLDGNLPTVRAFHFDSGSFNAASYDHVYSDSAEFETALPWPSGGWHRFYFEFSDGSITSATALDSFLVSPEGGCAYIPGDIGGNGVANGIDVVYGVAYLKGGSAPVIDCNPPCSVVPDPFFAAMDVNGNCAANGIDITFYVSYLKGVQQALLFCPDCPPEMMTTSLAAPPASR